MDLVSFHYRFRLTLLAASLVAATFAGCSGWRYGSPCLQSIKPAEKQELRASEHVRRAYSLLRDTEQFASSHIDYAGVPSCEVIAFQTLLNSGIADQAFKSLLKTATLEGQLYALSGLYFTDPKAFTMHVAHYRKMNDLVTTHFGCVIGEKSIATIVDASDALDPDSLAAWHRQNPLAEYPPVDIASGGLPREFKNAFK